MKACRLSLFFLGLCGMAALSHADTRPQLTHEERTNGTQLLGDVDVNLPAARASVTQILSENGRHVATAVWVGQEGYFLAKASEVPELEKQRIRWAEGQTAAIREIQRLTAHDLVLAQAVSVQGVTPVKFETAAVKTSYGQWLASPVKGGREIRIGVISAKQRKIPGFGAAMGIRMDEQTTPRIRGVRISGVAEESPAAAAGLRAGDVITSINQKAVQAMQEVFEQIKNFQPGDYVEVKYSRDGKATSARVRLASRTKVMMNWDGEDFANGGISLRTDNFASVIQHDLPLSPQDMGSPLFDLEGRALGINIARVDRVTTFALPASVFWKEVEPLIESDRHPPKALRPGDEMKAEAGKGRGR
jgi:S1-C subfamily serine protease